MKELHFTYERHIRGSSSKILDTKKRIPKIDLGEVRRLDDSVSSFCEDFGVGLDEVRFEYLERQDFSVYPERLFTKEEETRIFGLLSRSRRMMEFSGHMPRVNPYRRFGAFKKKVIETPDLTNGLEHLVETEHGLDGFLVVHNMRLLHSIAKVYASFNKGLSFNDLVGEGIPGLYRAAVGFSRRTRYKFSTYATYWVRHTMSRAVYNTSKLVRVPAYLQTVLRTLGKLRPEEFGDIEAVKRAVLKRMKKFKGEDLRDPKLVDEAYQENFGNSDRLEILRSGHLTNPVSLDKMVGEEEDLTLGDMIPATTDDPNSVFEEEHNRNLLYRKLLPRLTPRERVVISERYGLNGTPPKILKEVGRIINVTRGRARQIERRAIRKLSYMVGVTRD